MSNRDALFAVVILTLGTSGVAAMAASGQIACAAAQAQAVSFDVLAGRMIDGKACAATDGQ